MESSGKTTLTIHTIAEAQKNGGLTAFIDVEHAFDREYAKALGVNVDELDFSQPDCAEDALQILDTLINTGAYDVIVVDSVAALVPKAELEDAMGASKMGLQARLMGQALRKITPGVKRSNTLVIFINQIREKIGVIYGSNETVPGGNAMKFYASVRLDVRRSLTSENSVNNANKEKVGNLTTVTVKKNKLSPPFKKAEFNILYGIGIDRIGELIDLCNNRKIIKKWGSSITYMDVKYTVEDFSKLIIDNDDFYNELAEKYYAAEV